MKDEGASGPQARIDEAAAGVHSGCFFCGHENPIGLQLEFHAREDGSVLAAFRCGHRFEGYRETLHGGFVAALLDTAMTNCLFARGVTAVTAELRVRYLRPARPGEWTQVRASVARARRPAYRLVAEMLQEGVLVARAGATFMAKREAARPSP